MELGATTLDAQGSLGSCAAEQGPHLETANASLGVVTSIVGMRQLRVQFEGRQDHAGGCPMEERADAGLAAMRYA